MDRGRSEPDEEEDDDDAEELMPKKEPCLLTGRRSHVDQTIICSFGAGSLRYVFRHGRTVGSMSD